MAAPLLVTTLVRAREIRAFLIRLARHEGWEIAVCDDGRSLPHHLHTDWHRVEQVIWSLERQIAALRDAGWRDRGTGEPQPVGE